LNAIGEFDLELLQDYLDDALSPAQVQHVATRLGAEPELAAAMHELRAARVLRIATLRLLEPDETGAAAVSERIARAIRRDRHRQALMRLVRAGAAVAAAIAVFFAGWLLHESGSPGLGRKITQNSGSLREVIPVVAAKAPTEPFRVALVDESGTVIPVQRFSKMDDAREFAHDLARFEARRQEAQQGSAMLISDHF
jgi:anti-sigma factor RsiW